MLKKFLMTLAMTIAMPHAATAQGSAEFPVEILPLSFSPKGVGGEGGARLRADLGKAQFVALGEDHGFADAPLLAEALAVEMRRYDRNIYHAAEIGPYSASWLQKRLASGKGEDGLKAVGTGLAGKPLAMPFTSNVEDARLAAHFPDIKGKAHFWGIDQEFVGAPLILMEQLATDAPDKPTADMVRAIANADGAALAKGAFDDIWLAKARSGDFDALAARYKGRARSSELIVAMAASADIYQYNNRKAYAASNEARASLMRSYFMARYRTAGKAPRVLLKMGANHLGRGTTPVGIYDLGSLLPGLAEANGLNSLHIAFIPMGGMVRTISPSPTAGTGVQKYEDELVAPLLAAAGVATDKIGSSGHVLIPLAAIRYTISGKKRRELPEMARFLLEGFDYLVTTRNAKAATHFEAWKPQLSSP